MKQINTYINERFMLSRNTDCYTCHPKDRKELDKILRKRRLDYWRDNKQDELLDLNDIDVIATIDMKDVQISDDLESGNITGQIIQMVWKGDHYQLIVRTEDEEDFIVDTEWTWNEFDTVSIKIDESKIKLKLKEDLAKYEI